MMTKPSQLQDYLIVFIRLAFRPKATCTAESGGTWQTIDEYHQSVNLHLENSTMQESI